MKLLHMSDPHITEGPRFADQAAVLQAIVQSAAAGQVDASLVVGDLAGIPVPHVATVAERALLASFFQALAAFGPVVIVRGNHDDPDDIQLYRRLSGPYPIVVSTTPDVFHFEKLRNGLEGLDVFTLPWLTTASVGHALVSAGAPVGLELVRAEAITMFQAFVREWIASVPRQSDPRVLAAHIAIGGAKLAGGEVLLGHDVELPAALLASLDVDYVALGHVHLQQEVAPRVHYCGSPSAHSFGEPDAKGWWLVRIDEARELHMARVPSPAPRVVTIEATWNIEADAWEIRNDNVTIEPGAEIRVKAHIPETLVGTVDMAGLERLVGAWDPSRIVIDRKVVVTERVRSAAMARAQSIHEQAVLTLDTLEPPVDAATAARVLACVDDVVAACGFTN